MSDKRESGLRLIAIIVGIVLVVAAFVGVLLFNNVQRGPNMRIAFVVAESLAAGEPLRARHVLFENVTMDPALANLYVLEEEFPSYEGKILLSNLTYGQALMKVHLISGESMSRYSSFLKDPDNVVVYVPVEASLTPRKIVPGDHVNIWLVLGNAQGIVDLMDPTPTPTPFALETVGPLFGTTEPQSPQPPQATPVPPAEGEPSQDEIFDIEATETPTPTATAIVRFPIVDLIASAVKVIDVDTVAPRNEDELPSIRGLVVVVNGYASNRLLFAIHGGGRIVVGPTSPLSGDGYGIAPLPVPYDYEQFRIDARTKISEAARLGFFGPYMSGMWDPYLMVFAPEVHLSIQATRQAVLDAVGRGGQPRPYAIPTVTPVATPTPQR